MKTILAALFLVFYVSAQAQPEVIYSVDAKGKFHRYGLSFSDEFSNQQLNRSNWLTSYPWGQNYAGTCYQEWMTDGQNLVFEDGKVKMVLKEEKVTARGVNYESDTFKLQDKKDNYREWSYTSGMLFSKEQFKYGIFEVRFKLPTGAGLWPAFWLFGGKPNEEFDIFEAKGEKLDKVHYDMHCPDGGCKGFGNWLPMTGDFSTEFNTMSGEWNENAAFWFLNGQRIASWAGSLNEPANIIANLGLANNFGCAFGPGQDQNTPFPAVYEVDYIRVYQESAQQKEIIFTKNGTQSYVYEHGKIRAKKLGSELGKTKRSLKKINASETLGHIRVYKDEVGSNLVVQCDYTPISKKLAIQLLDDKGTVVVDSPAVGSAIYKLSFKDIKAGKYTLQMTSDDQKIIERIELKENR